jgi:tetratricopeptide (TPR) repeat protein
MKRIIAIIFVISLISLLSCSKKEEREKPPSNVNNSGQSLYEKLKEQTAKNPNDAEAWFYLADLYERSELYQQEIDALNKVVALKPTGYSYMKLGTAHHRLGEYKAAIKSFNAAKKYFPKYAVLYNNLAVAYGKIGQTDEEIAQLKKAISFRPRYSTARFNLGKSYLKQGKIALARKQYDELKKFDEGVAEMLKKEIDDRKK